VNDGSFLVARVPPDFLGETLEWLASDEPPLEPMDPLDFLGSAEIAAVYDLYKTQYSRLDARLNIPTPEVLVEFNRWVIVVDRFGTVLAFSCFKTTQHGLKLGLTASSDDAEGKAAVRAILRLGLNVLGVYGEVSEGVERVVAGRVPEVPLGVAQQVLGKALEPHEDGRHYRREITNVGPKTKLLVGRPILE
jgi:hypothetical protein